MEKENMPIELGEAMAHNTRAMNSYFSLTEGEKSHITRYINSSRSDDQSKSRTEEIAEMLANTEFTI